MVRLAALLAVLLASAFASTGAQAQIAGLGSAPARPADVVSWRVRVEGAARGQQAQVVFEATLLPGWKMYALDSGVGRPLTVGLDALPAGLTASAPTQSAPTRAHDDLFGAEAATFSGSAQIVQPLRVSRRAARGAQTVSGQVRYAVCDAQICLPPASAAFRVSVPVR